MRCQVPQHEVAQVGGTTGGNMEQVVLGAGHVEDGSDSGPAGGGIPKPVNLVTRVLDETHRNERLQRRDPIEVEINAVPTNLAGRLESPDPRRHRRLRGAHLGGKRGTRGTGVARESANQRPVDIIQRQILRSHASSPLLSEVYPSKYRLTLHSAVRVPKGCRICFHRTMDDATMRIE